MYCGKCGAENKPGVNFCGKCGQPMGKKPIVMPSFQKAVAKQAQTPVNNIVPEEKKASPAATIERRKNEANESDRRITISLIIGAVVVVIVIIIVASVANKNKKKQDFEDFVVNGPQEDYDYDGSYEEMEEQLRRMMVE